MRPLSEAFFEYTYKQVNKGLKPLCRSNLFKSAIKKKWCCGRAAGQANDYVTLLNLPDLQSAAAVSNEVW